MPGTLAFVAIKTTVLDERLDLFGKYRGLVVFLFFFSSLPGLGFVVAALALVCCDEFRPQTGAQPQHRQHQEGDVAHELEALAADAEQGAFLRAAQGGNFALKKARQKTG